MYESEGSSKATVFLVDHGMRDRGQIDKVFGRSIAANLRFLKQTYGLTVSAQDRETDDWEGMNIRGLYRADTWMSLQVLRQEIVKYPPDYIKQYIKKIRLASALSIPHPSNEQKRLSIGGKATTTGLVYVEQNYRNEPYTRLTFHHEVAHTPDLAEEWENNSVEVGKWMGNNPRRKIYLGNAYWNLTPRQRRRYSIRGFARLYGRRNPLEDRATVSEALIMDPIAAYQKGKNDRFYRGKLSQIRTDQARRTNGRMGDQYFEDLAAGRVGEGYWRLNKVRGLYISCWAEIDYRRGTYKGVYKSI